MDMADQVLWGPCDGEIPNRSSCLPAKVPEAGCVVGPIWAAAMDPKHRRTVVNVSIFVCELQDKYLQYFNNEQSMWEHYPDQYPGALRSAV